MGSNIPYLKIEEVSKHFPTPGGCLPVLEKINLEIREGEFICIVGPSGCGKTTLLNIIANLEAVTTGRILYKGKTLPVTGPDRLVIFQELGLFPWLTVQDNVEFGLKVKKTPSAKRKKIADEYLRMVNLIKFKNFFIHELSGGMKQRVALARALVMDPEILLMDEPFAALDAQTRDLLHQELQKIWSHTKKTILFVTHNVREAACLGDRVIVFSAQPASVKASFDINLPHPRQIESPGLMDIVRPIIEELKPEIEKITKINHEESN
ncbi:MAG: ABC transporter ATP-binding protein [Candidatus Omnitrophota bacterium]|nr:ABC transporter ATP-binding protein [Candidatus Omnitrophota bacterium]